MHITTLPGIVKKWMASGVSPDAIKTLEDVRYLPFTDKQVLRDTYPFGLFAVPMNEVARLHASSGTTVNQLLLDILNATLIPGQIVLPVLL